ncbi:hypothetical protein [Halosaccharopolyspora lacisalsi]|nr:hypothetical protein [Halosaccharopolyspora lacisalsi]
MVPPDYAAMPGTLPPWSRTPFGAAPDQRPKVGDRLERPEEKPAEKQREQVRAVGSAEALPTGASDRVAVPVLIAVVTLAAATAGLVRSWVLHRS